MRLRTASAAARAARKLSASSTACTKEKEAAINDQDYEVAANLRDAEAAGQGAHGVAARGVE